MKKIALAFAASMLVAGSAVACPGMEGGHGDNTPKTAKKADEPKKDAAKPAEKTADKKDAAKPAAEPKKDAAKPAEKTGEKKADKVSSR